MNLLDKIDQIIEEKDCPEGEQWWPKRKKCVPVGSGDGNGPRSKGKEVDEGIDSSIDRMKKEHAKKMKEAEKLLKEVGKKIKKNKEEFNKYPDYSFEYLKELKAYVELLNDIVYDFYVSHQ